MLSISFDCTGVCYPASLIYNTNSKSKFVGYLMLKASGEGLKKSVFIKLLFEKIQELDLSIVALSDGVGSVKFSHFRAENSVNFICNEFARNFDYYFDQVDGVVVKSKIINKINDNMIQLDKEHNCKILIFAHTLLFVAVKDDKFILFHISDSVIGYLKNGKIEVASKPINDEFANVTIFTTSPPNALQNIKIAKGKMFNINGFVLMGDGSEQSFYDKRSNTRKNFRKAFDLKLYFAKYGTS